LISLTDSVTTSGGMAKPGVCQNASEGNYTLKFFNDKKQA